MTSTRATLTELHSGFYALTIPTRATTAQLHDSIESSKVDNVGGRRSTRSTPTAPQYGFHAAGSTADKRAGARPDRNQISDDTTSPSGGSTDGSGPTSKSTSLRGTTLSLTLLTSNGSAPEGLGIRADPGSAIEGHKSPACELVSGGEIYCQRELRIVLSGPKQNTFPGPKGPFDA